jgi:hypothetical protein
MYSVSPLPGRGEVSAYVFGCSMCFVAMHPRYNYNFFSWNVRGLNNPTKREEVNKVIQEQEPRVVCL